MLQPAAARARSATSMQQHTILSSSQLLGYQFSSVSAALAACLIAAVTVALLVLVLLLQYEYLWADGVKYKKPVRLSAPEYVDKLFDWIEDQVGC